MPEPFVPADLLRIVGVADPRPAPDGRVVYRRWTFDRANDRIASELWRVDRGGTSRRLTAGWNDRLPRISPDGTTLAFVRADGDAARIALLPLDGGEARPCGDALPAIVALAWSPDGTRLALVATAEHDPATAAIFHDEPSGARHIRALPFKSDADGLLDGRRKHLAILDVESGALRWLTAGPFDVATPAWSPDGAQLAFSARIGMDEDVTAMCDVHVVDVASGTRRTLTGGDGIAQLPVYSHDGREIAYVGHTQGDDGGGAIDAELRAVPAGGGTPRVVSAGFPRSVGDPIGSDLRVGSPSAPAWTADDGEIVVQTAEDGCTLLRAFRRDGGGSRIVAGGERQIYAFAPGARGEIAIAYTTPLLPGDVALVAPDGAETRLTHVNDAWLAKKHVVAPHRYRPAGEGGVALDAWLLRPPAAREDPVPLVLEVHGGPHAAYGHAFFLEFQILASAGIAVAYGNPRGSQTYGTAYASAILGDWGGLDVRDCLAILDGALALGGFDPARIGVAGGSYGGFMTTWLLGHSDRFAAGVSMRAVNDHLSEIGASDLGWFLERELQTRWNDDAGRRLFELSPMRGAANITAPLLVEHSERDYRCPIDQGEQLFTLLRRLGRPAEFVRTTGDGHDLSRGGKPRSRVLRLRAIAQWLVRHLRPAGVVAAPDAAGALFAPLPGEAAYEDAVLAG